MTLAQGDWVSELCELSAKTRAHLVCNLATFEKEKLAEGGLDEMLEE